MADMKKFNIPTKKEPVVPKTSGKLPAGAYIGAVADPEEFIKGAAVTTSAQEEEASAVPAQEKKEAPAVFPGELQHEYRPFSSRIRVDLAEKLTDFCAAKRTTRTKVLEIALEEFFKKYSG